MKIFEMPNIEVIIFTAENVMSVSDIDATINNGTPWG